MNCSSAKGSPAWNSSAASRTLWRHVFLQRQFSPYPKDDVRYTPTLDESLERLNNTTYQQVVDLYKNYVGSQSGELTIIGDFDSQTNLAILKATFAGWKAAEPYTRITNTVPAGLAGGQHEINIPDKANATYVAGMVFPLRDDSPDYPSLVIGNYILGSGALPRGWAIASGRRKVYLMASIPA